jgi:Uncharacterised nucleotidyltransferase
MLPALDIIAAGLRRTTEAIATELAQPGSTTPDWNSTEWRLAKAVAAAHGVSPLLFRSSDWRNSEWRTFLETQREHIESRHQRIEACLKDIGTRAQSAGVPVMPLKGSALHALGIYAPGDRRMADIDLLVQDDDAQKTSELLREIGYVESFATWKHRVFKPATGKPFDTLGEHRDTPISIELHTRIHERLPLTTVDITEGIFPRDARPGLNPYPSIGALMSHLILHTAGNIADGGLRLIQLHDIACLIPHMTEADWLTLWDGHAADGPWWALPPLRLVERYYKGTVPESLLARVERECPPLLRAKSSRQTLTQVSCSHLWVPTLPGIEWSRSVGDALRIVRNRIAPHRETRQMRAAIVQTQLWAGRQGWATSTQRFHRMMKILTVGLPRLDMMYVVRAAFDSQGTAT